MQVVLTGTGTPIPAPDRAGAGVLVRGQGYALQFDAGRATTMRLGAAGLGLDRLSCLFITHHHSDHLLGVDDLVLSRWLGLCDEPLPVVAPAGPAVTFVERMLDAWGDDIALRIEHGRRAGGPIVDLRPFEPRHQPTGVWTAADVEVSAVLVEHHPVAPSVAYRVDSPDGSVVVSGDTRVCDAVEAMAADVDVLVHEACRKAPLAGSGFEFVVDYHADTVELGAMAARAGVGRLVLTHLIPAPVGRHGIEEFEADIRAGGYEGPLDVGADLLTVMVP